MITTLRKLKFQLSDLFLITWLILGYLIFFEDYRFVSYPDGNLLSFSQPFWLIIVYFALLIISLTVYLYLEYRNNNFVINKAVLLLLFFLLFSQLVTISLSPNNLNYSVSDGNGDIFLACSQYNGQVKCIHFFTLFFIIVTIFIGIFIIPKRIKHMEIIKLFFLLVYLFALSAFIYSLFVDDYIQLFQAFFSGTTTSEYFKSLCPKSFYGNPNAYGLLLELCVFVALINYYISKNKMHLSLVVIFYCHLILTLCKSGIVFTTISLVIFLVTILIKNIVLKNAKKIIACTSLLLVFSSVIIVLIIISNYLNLSFNILEGSMTFTGRTQIWSISISIMKSSSFIYGSGYGLYDSLIADASKHIGFWGSCNTHNAFLCILGRGGLIFLIPYTALIVLSIVMYIKKVKCSPIMIPVGCLILTIFLHSIFEDFQYFVIGSIVLMLIVIRHSELKEKH